MKPKLFLLFPLISALFLIACGQLPLGNNDEPEVPTPASTTIPEDSNSPRIVDTPTPSLPPTWTPGVVQNAPVNTNSGTTSTNNNDSTALPGVNVRDTYTIQRGDSLGAIAARFDVSLEALIRANNIDDPDHIEVGIVLIIPEE